MLPLPPRSAREGPLVKGPLEIDRAQTLYERPYKEDQNALSQDHKLTTVPSSPTSFFIIIFSFQWKNF